MKSLSDDKMLPFEIYTKKKQYFCLWNYLQLCIKTSITLFAGERYTLLFTVYNLPVGMNVSALRLKTSNSTTNNLNLVQIAGDFDSTYFVSTTLTSDVST